MKIWSHFIGGIAYDNIRRYTDIYPWGASIFQDRKTVDDQKDEAPDEEIKSIEVGESSDRKAIKASPGDGVPLEDEASPVEGVPLEAQTSPRDKGSL